MLMWYWVKLNIFICVVICIIKAITDIKIVLFIHIQRTHYHMHRLGF